MQLSTLLRCLVSIPLSLTGIVLMVIFSGLWTAVFWSPITGFLLALMLLTWMFRYAFVILDHAAESTREPPVLAIEMLYPDEKRVLIMIFFVILAFFGGRAADYWLGPLFKWFVMLPFVAILPAVFALQSLTGKLLEPFNPYQWTRLIAALRGGYAVILGWVAFIWIGGALLGASGTWARMPVFLNSVLIHYAWLATFALIGGVLFESRHEIELVYPPDVELEEDPREVARLHERDVDHIYTQWRAGKVHEAWAALSTHVEQSPHPVAELRELYSRSQSWPDTRLANRIAKELVTRLLAAGRTGEALDVARTRLTVQADFRPYRAAETLRLVELARAAGDKPTARRLLGDFERIFPQDPLRPRADELWQQLDG